MKRPADHSTSRSARAQMAPRSQAGVALIESIAALMLASIVVLALAAGMFTLLRTTDVTSRSQRMQAAVTAAAETVKSVDYIPCGTPGSYLAANPNMFDPLSPFVVSVTVVEYWDGSPVAAAAPSPGTLGSFGSPCPASDLGAQRVTVQVMLDGSTAPVTAQIVKRRAASP